MRTFVKVRIPTPRGSKALVEGTIPKIVGDFMERAKPEAAYFGADTGWRTAYFVIDLKESSELPPLFEPLFVGLDAEIEATPIMNAEELRTGLSQLKL
ncbi:MAG TPA: hypothetical protein VMI54_02890 [Polyangiaceae bacterium]|nr:hypothetical protein [Polyangiaceae bacterium]